MGNKSSKQVIGLGLLAASALGAYALYNHFSQSTSQGQDQQQSENQQSNQYPQSQQHQQQSQQTTTPSNKSIPREEIEKVFKGFRVIYEAPGQLSTESLFTILEQSPLLAQQTYKVLTVSNRELRRVYLKTDKNKYLDLVIKYNDDVEQLLEQTQLDVLSYFEITQEIFENNIKVLIQRGFMQQFMYLQAVIRQKIKEGIKSFKPLSVAQVKQAMIAQIKVIQDHFDFIKSSVDELKRRFENTEKIETIQITLSYIISDLVAIDNNIEEEDLQNVAQDPSLMTDPQVQQAFMQLEQLMVEIVGQEPFPMGMDEEAMMAMGMDQFGGYQ